MIHQTFYNLPEEKRRRITESAVKEFTSREYEKTSINRIVEDAKIPKGSFYQYFDSKDDLYVYCVKELHRALLEARIQRREGILSTGLHRAVREGIDKAAADNREELVSIIGERGYALAIGLGKVPRALRNSVMLEIAVELIKPRILEELSCDRSIRQDLDLDYYAYLLSVGDMLALDYGSSCGVPQEDLNRLNFEYIQAIYSAIRKSPEGRE